MPNKITWTCQYYCLEEIKDSKGYLFLPGNKVRQWYADRENVRLYWKLAHHRCYLPSQSDYRIDISWCRTVRSFYRTGLYLERTKEWFDDTDWWMLLDLSRTAPHPQGHSTHWR